MITLNETEKSIFDLLLKVVQTKSPETILRVAGGWVRDHLLGLESNDIDISINNMSGEQFATLVHQYMKENKIKTRGGVTVVKANPDQSKHLATAMLRIYGLPIDFVNLRKENYANSRIPTVEPGTPEEDASRRDLTINALFYNLNTQEVEDFVGGIDDLKLNLARTPLDPVQTFLDDPLRILRTIRFAAKYGLEIVPEIIMAANKPAVQDAFRNKVSAERVWKELALKDELNEVTNEVIWKPGALAGKDPIYAVELIHKMGLRDILFDLTEQEMHELGFKEPMLSWDEDQRNPNHDLNIWDHTVLVLKTLIESTTDEIRKDTKTYLVRNLAAILHDIGKRYTGSHQIHEKGHRTYHGHEDVSVEVSRKILNNMRAPREIVVRVVNMIGGHMKPHLFDEKTTDKAYRRYVNELGDDWQSAIDVAKADAYGKLFKLGRPEVGEKYEDLRAKMISAQNSMGQTSGKLISRFKGIGHDIMALGLKGKQIGEATDLIEEALLENPDMSREEALQLVKEKLL